MRAMTVAFVGVLVSMALSLTSAGRDFYVDPQNGSPDGDGHVTGAGCSCAHASVAFAPGVAVLFLLRWRFFRGLRRGKDRQY
ncbi:MAG: hypothetical protein GYA21_07910 [Myxococcales bacterium]|nr:hypothetical protein [Myxococcales bacterium]